MMKRLELKYSLVHLEVETRTQLAELASQLLGLINPVTPTMEQFMSIYTELSNAILEPLTDLEINVVSKMPAEPSDASYTRV